MYNVSWFVSLFNSVLEDRYYSNLPGPVVGCKSRENSEVCLSGFCLSDIGSVPASEGELFPSNPRASG